MTRLETPSDKSYVIAVCLSAIFGVIGIQHFYMGRYVEACIDLGLFIITVYCFVTGEVLLAVMFGLADGLHTVIVTFMLLTGSFRDGQGRLIFYPGQRLEQTDLKHGEIV